MRQTYTELADRCASVAHPPGRKEFAIRSNHLVVPRCGVFRGGLPRNPSPISMCACAIKRTSDNSVANAFWRQRWAGSTISKTSNTAKSRQFVVTTRVTPALYKVAAKSVSRMRLRPSRWELIQLRKRFPASASGATGLHSDEFHHFRHTSSASGIASGYSNRLGSVTTCANSESTCGASAHDPGRPTISCSKIVQQPACTGCSRSVKPTRKLVSSPIKYPNPAFRTADHRRVTRASTSGPPTWGGNPANRRSAAIDRCGTAPWLPESTPTSDDRAAATPVGNPHTRAHLH